MSGIASVFKKLFGLVNAIRKIIVNIVFFIVLILVIGIFAAEEEPIVVPENGVLVLELNGFLVEEETWVDPVDQFFNEAFGGGGEPPEILLADLLIAIENAASDERISGIQLNLTNFMGGGFNKLKQVGLALQQFRETGKPVITYADSYGQNQYYLAAHADNLYMNPLGMMMFEGFGSYRLYFKELLEKLKVSTHVFKVGAYKSAVEPYTRNDMSDQAREANQVLYDELWQAYISDLANLRDIDARILSGDINDFNTVLAEQNNDFALLAKSSGLVDELYSREQFRQEMISLTGLDKDEKSWRQISHHQYLKSLNGEAFVEDDKKRKNIAIVVARGVIVDGSQKAGMIGGDSTAELLRQARLDDDVKAVVLRIDSPGGSGFASEIIRQEVLELQKAGKPVIASMSSVAASGGYWIAASADEIWAAPSTITGSIGVFGMFFTFENSLAEIGVYNDGYHTTNLPVLDITKGLDDNAKRVVQLSIEKFYKDFVSMVAESRDMSYEEVHAVAQGRVWTGSQALEHGLVDQLGELNDAIRAAAQYADLTEYDVKLIEPELSPRDQFMREFFGQASILLPVKPTQKLGSPIEMQLQGVWKEVKLLDKFNDPNGVYALCELCPLQ
ncbi:signal peptide peptidase SppA [Pseudidiomarina donghaiensis]|uniref:signal peptide peptidase SppA n=1 Tax=Pseudidiomarina donghaiensis TaxID=519452 RepID=UPI003A9730D8